MKREIKFRAWDGSQMLQDFSLTIEHYFGLFKGQIITEYIQPLEGIESGEPIFSDNCLTKENEEYELLQYTGLKDKNGKEIYEGDIMNDNGLTYQICYFDAGFSGVTVPKNTKHDDAYVWQIAAKGEVIGNIYENKELLAQN